MNEGALWLEAWENPKLTSGAPATASDGFFQASAVLLPNGLPPPLKLKAPPDDGITGKNPAEEDAELALTGKPLPIDNDEAALLIPEDEAALLPTELPPPLKLKAPPADGITGKEGADEATAADATEETPFEAGPPAEIVAARPFSFPAFSFSAFSF